MVEGDGSLRMVLLGYDLKYLQLQRLPLSSLCSEREIYNDLYLNLYSYTFQPLDTILRQVTPEYFSKSALRGIFNLKSTLTHITHAVMNRSPQTS